MNTDRSLLQRVRKHYSDEPLQRFIWDALKYGTKTILRYPYQFNVSYDIEELIRIHYEEYETDHFEAPLNPYKILWVDIDQIDELTRRPLGSPNHLGVVKSGDWDQRDHLTFVDHFNHKRRRWTHANFPTLYFSDSMFHTSLLNHFEHNVPWEDTDYYRYAVDHITRGGSVLNGISSVSKLEKDLQHTENLYYSIKNFGYKQQKELKTRGLKYCTKHEIKVDIGRDGQFLFYSGYHRLSIAKILNINKVPVVVITRHKEWMKKRDEIYLDNLDFTHPDIKGLHSS